MKQFFYFGIVGTIGFIVDSLTFLFLVYIIDFDIFLSRVLSFIVAVFSTWILNRMLTFKQIKSNQKLKEYIDYFLVQTIGAAINFSVFFFLVNYHIFFKDYLLIPLAVSSIVAMFFNYFVIRKVLIRRLNKQNMK